MPPPPISRSRRIDGIVALLLVFAVLVGSLGGLMLIATSGSGREGPSPLAGWGWYPLSIGIAVLLCAILTSTTRSLLYASVGAFVITAAGVIGLVATVVVGHGLPLGPALLLAYAVVLWVKTANASAAR